MNECEEVIRLLSLAMKPEFDASLTVESKKRVRVHLHLCAQCRKLVEEDLTLQSA